MNELDKNTLAARFMKRITRPVEKFMELEAASGLTLIIATLAALAVANSSYAELYHQLIHLQLGVKISNIDFVNSFEYWVNDGLMVIFFYFVGLEIKREILIGELSSPKKAALPIVAALGGMVAPAIIYALINKGQPSIHGWAVPMATDIAFAVGAIVLLGKRVPFALKIFLLALAIADDLGAVLVIAVFYTEQISFSAIYAAAALIGVIVFFRSAGVRMPIVYFALSVLTWLAVLKSGVHATVSGVVLGFLTPLTPLIPTQELKRIIGSFNSDHDHSSISQLRDVYHYAMSPVERMIETLAPWVSFAIMPIFAFTNAGLTIGKITLPELLSSPISLGIGFGLALGKPLGITLFAFIAYKLRLITLPSGITWWQIIGVGMLAGIGFTMSLFIGHLSFHDPHTLDIAKLSILLTSLFSAIVGSIILYFATRSRSSAG